MKRAHVVLLLLFVGSAILWADVNRYEGTRYHFTGMINKTYPIFMTLTLEDLKATGFYYYYSIGTCIDLEGTYTNDGTFLINESVDDECTGTFSGVFMPNCTSASGSWSNKTGTKRMPFSLTQIAGDMVIESPQYDITAHMPQLVDHSVAVQGIVEDTIRSLFQDFLDSYAVDMEDEPEWEWAFECDYSIEYYKEFFVSLLLEIYEYTGGAHGNVYYVCLNCLEEKGDAEFLTLEDFFLDDVDYARVLSELCMAELKKQEAAWIMDGSIQGLNADYLIYNVTPKGLLFTFAPYAVGPYAEGPHWVVIPYSKLKNIIDDQGPLRDLVR
jgi:hypothetical protein